MPLLLPLLPLLRLLPLLPLLPLRPLLLASIWPWSVDEAPISAKAPVAVVAARPLMDARSCAVVGGGSAKQ
jgi:hypothetical protein